jgi:hypothetical protein
MSFLSCLAFGRPRVGRGWTVAASAEVRQYHRGLVHL